MVKNRILIANLLATTEEFEKQNKKETITESKIYGFITSLAELEILSYIEDEIVVKNSCNIIYHLKVLHEVENSDLGIPLKLISIQYPRSTNVISLTIGINPIIFYTNDFSKDSKVNSFLLANSETLKSKISRIDLRGRFKKVNQVIEKFYIDHNIECLFEDSSTLDSLKYTVNGLTLTIEHNKCVLTSSNDFDTTITRFFNNYLNGRIVYLVDSSDSVSTYMRNILNMVKLQCLFDLPLSELNNFESTLKFLYQAKLSETFETKIHLNLFSKKPELLFKTDFGDGYLPTEIKLLFENTFITKLKIENTLVNQYLEYNNREEYLDDIKYVLNKI